MTEIHNNNKVESQLNANEVKGNIYFAPKTKLAKMFEKLQQEVASNERFEKIMEALKYYHTKLDGSKDMATKLQDGGFNDDEITTATRRKEKYAKRLEQNKFFEYAQKIDYHIFGEIINDFETYVQPLINNNAPKDEIKKAVTETVINPIIKLLNEEGEDDDFLNYNKEDILGMIYYLTGRCHINWKNYDSI
jgi:hypothetical protein